MRNAKLDTEFITTLAKKVAVNTVLYCLLWKVIVI